MTGTVHAMMTGVSAIMTFGGRHFWIMAARGGLAVVVMAGGFTVWYRATYHAWPGQELPSVHWCGRNYQADLGQSETWQQVTSQERRPVRLVGWYPPVWPHQELFAAPMPDRQRFSVHPPLVCAVVIYLRTGPDRYEVYALEGGP
jgi:hypothetical protein